MKTLKKIAVAIIILTTLTIKGRAGFADDAAVKGLPIQNLGVLKAYAEDSVVKGAVDIYSPDTVPGGMNYQSVHIPGGNAASVIEALRSKVFSFELAESTALARPSVYLSNKDGVNLFYDSKATSFEEWKVGLLWLRDSSLRPRLVESPPITIPGLESARVVVKDDSGQVIADRHLRVENSNLFYSTNLVEREGDMFLTFREKDGSQTGKVFDIASGKVKSTVRASGYVGIDIEGDYYFGTNPPGVELFGVDIRSALVKFNVETEGGRSAQIRVGGRSTSGEVPIGFLTRFRFTESSPWPTMWKFYSIPDAVPDGYMEFYSGAEWQLVYVLTPADLRGVPVFPDWGKGQ